MMIDDCVRSLVLDEVKGNETQEKLAKYLSSIELVAIRKVRRLGFSFVSPFFRAIQWNFIVPLFD